MLAKIELEILGFLNEGLLSDNQIDEKDLDADLSSIGINSISFMMLVVGLEEVYSIEFSDEDLDLNKFKNIKCIAAYIENKIRKLRGIAMKEKVIKILSEVKADESLAESLDGMSDIINEVGLDSLQMINFILGVEDEFEIEIDFEEFNFSDLGSIDTFCEFITQKSRK